MNYLKTSFVFLVFYSAAAHQMVIDRYARGWGYGTHIAPLITAVINTSGPVLEMGCGDFSTPLLHAICKTQDRFLVSAETDAEWMKLFLDLSCSWHHFLFIPAERGKPNTWSEWDKVGIDHHWGVIFVDHAPGERRSVDIKRLANRADIIVVHDTEEAGYRYEPVFAQFKYRYDYPRYKTRTTLVSNSVDVKKLFD